jgi:DNA-directed RNA polymerase specialized sigma24 family protein
VAALAEAEAGSPAGLALSQDEAERVRACFEAMPRRTRYVLTVRLGLGVPQQRLREAAEPLALHLTRIHQLQLYALDALLHAASDGHRVTRPGLRTDIIEGLRGMAREAPAASA